MIAVCDVNTIWRHRPFDAMAKITDVLGFAPCDRLGASNHKVWSAGDLDVVDVWLPPSWASRTAWLGQRLLWHRMKAEAKRRKKQIECVVVTNPHYSTLLGLLPEGINTVYYASDDFRSYIGWNNMVELEAKMVRRVDHAFFISEELASRACSEYGMDAGKVSVSMNGTEERFFPAQGERLPMDPPSGPLSRPIAGVVGGINDRLDFDLLMACADLEGLGTLLLVGPLPEALSPALERLLGHPKCISVGGQPHDVIHRWYKCLDVGLIPYVVSDFNRFCSPLRLFDHLASGQPIVSTSACGQVESFAPPVIMCSNKAGFVETLEGIVRDGYTVDSRQDDAGIPLKQSWRHRAAGMLSVIDGL